MKRILIIKDSKAKIIVNNDYLVVKSIYEDKIVAFRYISALYINKLADLSISDVINLSKYFDVFFINQHGNILASLKLEEDIQ